ncbi:MAG TPA: type I-B CRISPR-associated protein Cas7/Cst2/DevR [Firmicutes bacterium]|nr:type I-B CRISPR-associated protein Cas7/Cst2/DevR [Bacillota bacterium]
MKVKAISLVWLAKADLSNLNSGQGSGNLTELKTYDRGRKPYVSGQSVRTALFNTMAREHPEEFICTAELPCTDVEKCWGCDLRGFLAPKQDVGGERRWSPLKVTPALGQVASDVVTDLLTRHSVREKEDRASQDQRIAHVQMMANIYRLGMVIDVDNIGRILTPELKGTGQKQEFTGWKTAVNINPEQRRQRIAAVLDGIFNLSGFAKQARAAASLAPEIVLIAIQPTYSQRGLRALELDDAGAVKTELLASILGEHQAVGNTLLFGYTPDVVTNDNELLATVTAAELKPMTVYEAFKCTHELLKTPN